MHFLALRKRKKGNQQKGWFWANILVEVIFFSFTAHIFGKDRFFELVKCKKTSFKKIRGGAANVVMQEFTDTN